MKLLHGLLFALFLFSTSLPAQGKWDYNWIVGNGYIVELGNPTTGTLLNFSKPEPAIAPIVQKIYNSAATVTMSDSTGKLIFYSNGCCIVNALHDTMPNGDSLGRGIFEYGFCSSGMPLTQGAATLPKPGSNTIYYFFNVDFNKVYDKDTLLPAPLHVYYSTIDMALAQGSGRVIQKNQALLTDTLARGALQAQRHRNGQDWWLLAAKSHSNCYHTILLDKNGPRDSFLQCTGTIWGDDDEGGQAVFSPNGKKYVRYRGKNGINIYDFDDATGRLSNHVRILLPDSSFWNGAAISSNSRYLYATAYRVLYQFDLKAPDIEASKQVIAWWVHQPQYQYRSRFYQMRLGPDGKIYMGGTNNSQHLHVIHNPNCPGRLCDFEPYAIQLYTLSSWTLPAGPHFRSWPDTDVCTVGETPLSDSVTNIRITPNPGTGIFRIEIGDNSSSQPCELSVFDANGRHLRKTQTNFASTIVLDISDLEAGIYWCQVVIGNQTVQTSKLMLIK